MRENLGFIAIGVAGVVAWALIGYGQTFGREDYNPNEVTKDGPFRAPRVWLHVQKVMIACTVYAIALSLFLALDWWASWPRNPFEAAAIFGAFGPFLFSKIRERIDPTDPERHTLGEMALDAVTDASLYGVVWILYAITVHRWELATIDAVALATLYRLCRNGARP